MKYVGSFLPENVFSHGQLNVAMSRVTNENNLKIVTTRIYQNQNLKANIVFKEVLS